MYAAHTGTFLRRDPLSESDEPILGYSHEAVTGIMALHNERPSRLQDGTDLNLYAYSNCNPVNRTDPSGLYAAPGYGHYCGPRSGEESSTPVDCLDEACKAHDDCIPGINTIWFWIPGQVTYCDQTLSIAAYYCLFYGCNSSPDPAACRAAAAIIAPWMALPGCGTFPVLGRF